MIDSRLQSNRAALIEATTLCGRMLELAEARLPPAGPRDAMGGGITRLHRFESLFLETRFRVRDQQDGMNWLLDSLRLRLRQDKYRCAGLLLPEPHRLSEIRAATLFLAWRPHARRPRFYSVSLREKRRGRFAIGTPAVCEDANQAALWRLP